MYLFIEDFGWIKDKENSFKYIAMFKKEVDTKTFAPNDCHLAIDLSTFEWCVWRGIDYTYELSIEETRAILNTVIKIKVGGING